MKKILVISDSHGYPGFAKKAIEKEAPFDFLVHCGGLPDKNHKGAYEGRGQNRRCSEKSRRIRGCSRQKCSNSRRRRYR